METWEKVLLGVLVLLVLLWFRPGIKAAFQPGQGGSREDWLGLLLPIGLVIAFVILLIAMA